MYVGSVSVDTFNVAKRNKSRLGLKPRSSARTIETISGRKEEQIPPGIETGLLRQYADRAAGSQRGTNPAWD